VTQIRATSSVGARGSLWRAASSTTGTCSHSTLRTTPRRSTTSSRSYGGSSSSAP